MYTFRYEVENFDVAVIMHKNNFDADLVQLMGGLETHDVNAQAQLEKLLNDINQIDLRQLFQWTYTKFREAEVLRPIISEWGRDIIASGMLITHSV